MTLHRMLALSSLALLAACGSESNSATEQPGALAVAERIMAGGVRGRTVVALSR